MCVGKERKTRPGLNCSEHHPTTRNRNILHDDINTRTGYPEHGIETRLWWQASFISDTTAHRVSCSLITLVDLDPTVDFVGGTAAGTLVDILYHNRV